MYIATSAFRSSSSAPSGPPVRASAVAMPIDARTKTSLPSRWNGPSSDARIRAATSAASTPSPPSSSRIANSSPPSRAAVSACRSEFFSRSPTSASIRSPAAWPSESLIVLKSSRSMNRIETGRLSRACRSIMCSTRSLNSARFASPVTASWNAWCCSCSSNALRSETSRVFRTMPLTFSSCSRFVRRVSTCSQKSSRCRIRNSVRPGWASPSRPPEVRNCSTPACPRGGSGP